MTKPCASCSKRWHANTRQQWWIIDVQSVVGFCDSEAPVNHMLFPSRDHWLGRWTCGLFQILCPSKLRSPKISKDFQGARVYLVTKPGLSCKTWVSSTLAVAVASILQLLCSHMPGVVGSGLACPDMSCEILMFKITWMVETASKEILWWSLMFGTRPCRHIISFDQQEGSVSSTAALRHQLMENDNSFSDRSWDVYLGDVLIQSDLPEAEKIRFKDPIP